MGKLRQMPTLPSRLKSVKAAEGSWGNKAPTSGFTCRYFLSLPILPGIFDLKGPQGNTPSPAMSGA